MKRKTFRQYLQESPIADFKTFGDFNKNSSFKDPKDRMMITHPRAIEHIKKKFGNSSIDWNLYFLNEPGAGKFAEQGKVNIDWLKQNIKNKDLIDQVSKNLGTDTITIIFTNNNGTERKNMSAWIMSHRIAHSLKSGYQYMYYTDHLYKQCMKILKDYYNVTISNPKRDRRSEKILLLFFNEICTFKSARDKNIRNAFEVSHELVAQYITTGNVKFNSAPQRFGNRNFGASCNNIEEASDSLITLSRDMEFLIDDVFSESIGEIFVM